LLLSGVDEVLTLGDNQYNSASLSNFTASYDPSWGRVKLKTLPTIGNHEGSTSTSGEGYCRYFGVAAHCNTTNTQGGAAYYSTDVGGWHVIVLNSNCTAAGGCDVGSPQYRWLQNDLAAHPATCTLASWHHPRWSTGHDGSNAFMQPIWKLLYDNGADLVLSGHSHDYERFAPIDGNGNVNPTDGMREFVVGTGGAFFTGFGTTIAPGSEVRNNKTFGVLKLTLRASGYDWRFVPESGSFTDYGSQNCRGATVPPDTQPPTAPAGLSASAASSSKVDLSWTASRDDHGNAGYEIWRGPQAGTLPEIATTTRTRIARRQQYRDRPDVKHTVGARVNRHLRRRSHPRQHPARMVRHPADRRRRQRHPRCRPHPHHRRRLLQLPRSHDDRQQAPARHHHIAGRSPSEHAGGLASRACPGRGSTRRASASTPRPSRSCSSSATTTPGGATSACSSCSTTSTARGSRSTSRSSRPRWARRSRATCAPATPPPGASGCTSTATTTPTTSPRAASRSSGRHA